MRREWDTPPEDCDPPVEAVEWLKSDLKYASSETKKQVKPILKAILKDSLKGDPGRPKGTPRKLPPEAIPLWLAGIAPVSIRLKLHIPNTKDKPFKNRLNAAIKRLPDAERLAGKAAQQRARDITRKASSVRLVTKSL
jgi:hypothetical protein